MSDNDHHLDPAEIFRARNAPVPRIVPAVSPEDPAARAPQVRVVVGPQILRGDGSYDEPAVQSWNAIQAIGDGSKGILTTGKSKTGTHRAASELGPEDLVRVDGVDVEVRLAERLGYLRRGPGGILEEVEGGPPKDDADKPKDAPQEDAGEALSDPQVEGDLAAIVGGTDAGTQVRALLGIIETGEVNRNTLDVAASQLKMEPRELAEKLEGVKNAFHGQAVAFAKGAGITDYDSFAEWAEQSRGREFQEAMRRHGMERSTAGYAALASEYIGGLAERDPEAILTATFPDGGSARRDGNGRVLINIPGRGEMEWRNAVRLGFVGKGIKGL